MLIDLHMCCDSIYNIYIRNYFLFKTI